jgi:hypothetical protein
MSLLSILLLLIIFSFQTKANDIEKLEEAKLKAKFPSVEGRPIIGHSAFLQKRLAKGVSFIRYTYSLYYNITHLYIVI